MRDPLDEYRDKMPYLTWPKGNETGRKEIEVDSAGATHPGMVFRIGLSMCGDIYDGVSLRWSDEQYAWVIPFAALERVYLENKRIRDEAGLKEAPSE